MASETHRPEDRVVPYLGVNVNTTVTSLLEHFTLAVECLVRTVAVDTAVLSPLFCEKDVALPGRVAAQAKVHKSLVEASRAARAAAESYLAGFDATSKNIANEFLLSRDTSTSRCGSSRSPLVPSACEWTASRPNRGYCTSRGVWIPSRNCRFVGTVALLGQVERDNTLGYYCWTMPKEVGPFERETGVLRLRLMVVKGTERNEEVRQAEAMGE